MTPRALLVACALALPAAAAAQPVPPASPPSKTLERAIKLYDKVDYFSASIELTKVTSGESGDDPANVARAQFFMAKTLVRLGFHAASLTWFERCMPPHAYNEAAVKWLVDQLRKRPNEQARALLESYSPQILGAPSIAAEDRAWIAYFRGERVVRTGGPRAEAEQMLGSIPAGSPAWPRAQLALAELRFRHTEVPPGVAHALAAATAGDPVVALDAVRALAFWPRSLGDAAAARAALAKIAEGTDAAAGAAALEASRIAAEADHPVLARAGVEVFEGVILSAACSTGRADDALGAAATIAAGTLDAYDRLLEIADDLELAIAARKRLHGPADPADRILRVLLADPDSREILAWHREIADEVELIANADKAWQTTWTASEILQNLAILGSLAEVDVGRRIRNRLEAARAPLTALAGAKGELSAGLPGAGAALVVTPALCAAAVDLEPPAAAVAQGTPTVTTQRPHGCGCATSRRDPLGAAAIALALLVAARRRRRR